MLKFLNRLILWYCKTDNELGFLPTRLYRRKIDNISRAAEWTGVTAFLFVDTNDRSTALAFQLFAVCRSLSPVIDLNSTSATVAKSIPFVDGTPTVFARIGRRHDRFRINNHITLGRILQRGVNQFDIGDEMRVIDFIHGKPAETSEAFGAAFWLILLNFAGLIINGLQQGFDILEFRF
jgi:hypothetical protein